MFAQLVIAMCWEAKWQQRRNDWQRWYGWRVNNTVQILADTKGNRRLFRLGII